MIGKKEYSTVEFARDGVTVDLFYNELNMYFKTNHLLSNVITDIMNWMIYTVSPLKNIAPPALSQ